MAERVPNVRTRACAAVMRIREREQRGRSLTHEDIMNTGLLVELKWLNVLLIRVGELEDAGTCHDVPEELVGTAAGA